VRVNILPIVHQFVLFKKFKIAIKIRIKISNSVLIHRTSAWTWDGACPPMPLSHPAIKWHVKGGKESKRGRKIEKKGKMSVLGLNIRTTPEFRLVGIEPTQMKPYRKWYDSRAWL
jgi:hypothetical protein